MLETEAYVRKSQAKAKIRVGVTVYLRNGEEVLLQLRKNTGLFDDYWDAGAGGGVEIGQTPMQAGVDEAFQELGITIAEEDLKLFGVTWVISERGEHLMVLSMFVDKWKGIPKICEPSKCAEIQWFNVHRLPENIIPARREALRDYINCGTVYTESIETV